MIRVLVVALSPIVRAGLATVLAENPKFQVFTSGANANIDILTKIGEQQPDVLLLDWNNDKEFWDAYVSQSQYTIPLVVIASNDQLDVNFMLRVGVRGILSPESCESEIILTIETVATGMIVFHPEMIDYLLAAGLSTEVMPTNPNQVLTPREIEVLQLLASGSGNKVIAQSLHISEHTVKFHISSIFQKLNVSTRTQAVAVGIRVGLVLL